MWQSIDPGDFRTITLDEGGDWAVRLSDGRRLLLWRDGSLTSEKCPRGIVTKEPGEGKEIVVERFFTVRHFKFDRCGWLSYSERRPLTQVLVRLIRVAAEPVRVISEITILDDLGSIFRSQIALQLLLAALEHPTTSDRSRRVVYKRQDHEECVNFRGDIICISNICLHDEEMLAAFKSRVHTLDYNPTNAQLGAFMLELAERGWPPARPTITPREAVEIARYLISELLRLGCRFDLRLFVDKALRDFEQVKDGEAESDWRDLVSASLEQHLMKLRHPTETPQDREATKAKEHELILKLLAEFPTREEQVAAWRERTGKSERAFYRRLAELDRR
jgi:hypothetical protein